MSVLFIICDLFFVEGSEKKQKTKAMRGESEIKTAGSRHERK